MRYENFKYLFPPRPCVQTAPENIGLYDNGEYVAAPKYNGTACMIFTNGEELHVYNRHKMQLANWCNEIDFRGLAKGKKGWYVYAGEYLNKGKIGEMQTKEKDKFVIWDILVWESNYLIGSTFQERLDLLEKVFPCTRGLVSKDKVTIYDHLCWTELNGIFKAPAYITYFKALYEDLIDVPLYEGIVLKKLQSKLTLGFNERNNHDWQIKIRKPTKIYNF